MSFYPLGLGHPENTPSKADRKLWPLREVERVFQFPMDISDYQYNERALINDQTGDKIITQDIIQIPDKNAIIIISPNVNSAYILVGPELTHRATIALEDFTPLSLKITSEEIIIELMNGAFMRISIEALWRSNRMLKDYEFPSEIQKIHLEDIGAELAYLKKPLINYKSFTPFRTLGGKLRLLFWNIHPFEVHVFEWNSILMHSQKLKLLNTNELLQDIVIESAILSIKTLSIYFADTYGSRVFELNPNSIEPKLKLVAGDGNSTGQLRFSNPPTSRLAGLKTICEFCIEEEDGSSISQIAVPISNVESVLRIRSHSQISNYHIETGSKKTQDLITGTPFLVAISTQTDARTLAYSISLPRTGSLAILPENSRRVLPIAPFPEHESSTLWLPEQTSASELKVTQSPGLSLLFFRKGGDKVGLLSSGFPSYFQKLAMMKSAQRKITAQIKNANRHLS